MRTNLEFRIGSNTKTWTGTVILQLVQEGRLRLSDPVSKFHSGIPRGNQITIAQLLEMRSGINTYSNELSFNRTLDRNRFKVWKPEQLVQMGIALPRVAKPGGDFFYSNTNTVLLGQIIQKLTHHSLRYEFQHRIFDRLHLHHTSFPRLTDSSIPGPHPHGYMFGTNVSTLVDPALPEPERTLALEGKLLPNDWTQQNPSWGWAAGAGISNASDLATYVKAMVGGGLLDRKLTAARIASVQPSDPTNPASAGYGWAIAQFGTYYGHDGSLPGFQSFMGYDPQSKTSLIVLTNLQNTPDGEGAANILTMAVIAALNS